MGGLFSLPLNVIVCRDQYQSGREEVWMLLDTKPLTKEDNAAQRRTEYSIRVEIEGHRQIKCFWDLAKFTSVAFSMVLNQIIFVTLTFNLLQLFLKQKRLEEGMPRRTRLPHLRPRLSHFSIFMQQSCAFQKVPWR